MTRQPLPASGYRLTAAFLLLVAWGLLLFGLDRVPPGFQHDQMFNSRDALSVLRGEHAIYFPANFGREALGIYAAALGFRLAGGHYVWSLRFATVMAGMVGVALTLSLARRHLPRWAALFATAGLAGCFWFLFVFRLGLEPAMLLPLATAMIYFLERGMGTTKVVTTRYAFFLAGLMGGLAVHTYLASRALFGLAILLLAHEGLIFLVQRWRQQRDPASISQRRILVGLLLTLGLMAALTTPLLLYTRSHPGIADQRLGELNAPLMALAQGDPSPALRQVVDTVSTLLWRGSEALPYQYNLPGRPMLQPLWAVLFVTGLLTTCARWWQGLRTPSQRARGEFLLLAGLAAGLAPVLLSSADAFHVRGVIALPLLYIIAARGLWQIVELARRLNTGVSILPAKFLHDEQENLPPRHKDTKEKGLNSLVSSCLRGSRLVWFRLVRVRISARLWQPALVALLLLLLFWHLAEDAFAYFITWAQAEPTQRIYNGDLRAIAAYLDDHPTDEPIAIGTERLVDLDALTYQLYEPQRQDVTWFSAQADLPIPAAGQALYFLPTSAAMAPASTLLIEAAHDRFTLPGFVASAQPSGPGGQYDLVQGLRLSANDAAQVVQRANGQPLASPPIYGGALRLDAAGARGQDETVALLTHWTVVGPWPHPTPPGQPRQPIKFSASLLDSAGYKWTQTDQSSSLPFTFWRSGDSYLELTRLSLPADLPPGEYSIRLALYDDVGGAVTAATAGFVASAQPSGAVAVTADAAVAAVQITTPGLGAPPSPPYGVEQTAGADRLRLAGKWEPVDTLVIGVPSDVHLSWQAVQPLDTQDLHFRLLSKTPDGSVLWEQELDPLQHLPPSWPAGHVYRLTHRVPPLASSGSGDIQLEVCARQGDERLACGIIGQPHVVDQPPLLALPRPPQHLAAADWNGQLTLAGYDVSRQAEEINLTLYWQVAGALVAPLKRFVHAVDQNGQIVAQADGIPANGTIPMPFWRPGEYVIDQVRMPLASEQRLDSLYLGLYDPETGQRAPLRLPSGESPDDQRLRLALP